MDREQRVLIPLVLLTLLVVLGGAALGVRTLLLLVLVFALLLGPVRLLIRAAYRRRSWSRFPGDDRPPPDDWDWSGGGGGAGGPVPWPGAPPPGLSERGPRQRGPRAEASAYAVPEEPPRR